MNVTFGVILGDRGFCPDHRCDAGRAQVLSALEQLGFRTVNLPVDTWR